MKSAQPNLHSADDGQPHVPRLHSPHNAKECPRTFPPQPPSSHLLSHCSLVRPNDLILHAWTHEKVALHPFVKLLSSAHCSAQTFRQACIPKGTKRNLFRQDVDSLFVVSGNISTLNSLDCHRLSDFQTVLYFFFHSILN